MLPFKTIKKDKPTLVEDGAGNSIEIPAYGCLTYNESIAFESVIAQASDLDTAFKANVAASLLKLRFKIDDDLTADEILTDGDGVPIGQPLVDAIYDFFATERRRGEPDSKLLIVDGDDSEAMAADYAKRRAAILYKLGKRCIVTSEPIISGNWTLIADHTVHNGDEGGTARAKK